MVVPSSRKSPPPPRPRTVASDTEQIAAVAARLRAGWSTQAALPAVSPPTLRGILQKAERLGFGTRETVAAAATATAIAALALADARDPDRVAPVFILAGDGGDAAPAIEAADEIAAAGRPVIVALCSSRARPGHAAAAAAWDRLESRAGVQRFRIPDAREAAHFRAGIERVALLVEALGGDDVARALPAPLEAAVDLVRRARRVAVPCLAIEGPVGFDAERGLRRRGAPGADLSLVFHRALDAHRLPAARALIGELVVAPLGLPVQADPAAR
ncbi:MAG: YjeF-related protein N-terminus [Chloroflexota bacterium]